MGKQIAVVLAYDDEVKFLNYLKSCADITLIESKADTKELLYKSDFEKEFNNHFVYYIWNKAFQWQPIYEQDIYGKYYISNISEAPLIEYMRSNIEKENYGRLYWSKYFAAPNGLNYDVEKFNKWYEQIVRWIKKNAEGTVKDAWITYFLPSAWHLYNKGNNINS